MLIPVFPVLVFDYACSSNASGCLLRYDSCNGHRNGSWMCGRCQHGFGEALNTARCIGQSECLESGLRVAAWVLIPVGVVAVVVFYVAASGGVEWTGKETSEIGFHDSMERRGLANGLVTILVTLFQLEWIIRSDDPDNTSTLAHASQFQFIPAWFGSSICLWPNMGTVSKALFPGVVSFSLPLVMALVYWAHGRLTASGWTVVRPSFPSRGRYKRAFVSLMVFAYGTLASVATRLVTPLAVASYGTFQALTGEPWAEQWHFWLGAVWLGLSTLAAPFFFLWGMAHLRALTMGVNEFAWGVVFPVPVLAWRGLRRLVYGHGSWRSMESRKNATLMFSLLCAPYREDRWGWDSVMMGRRLLFVLPSLAMYGTPVGRAYSYLVLAVTSFAVHDRQHPFRYAVLNKVETASLYSLVLLCGSNLLSAYQRSHGVAVDTPLDVVGQMSTWMLRAVAAFSGCVVVLRLRGIEFGRARKGVSGMKLQLRRFSRRSGSGGSGRARRKLRGSSRLSTLASPLLMRADGTGDGGGGKSDETPYRGGGT